MWQTPLEKGKHLATDLIEINADSPETAALDRAAGSILRGKIIAIPTDGLYTLVADPFNLQTIVRVFQAKGRESVRSLPLLVEGILMAEEYAKETTSRFTILARHFWPGSLTIIVPASEKVPLKVTGNTGRLALRQSKSPVVAGLLERVGRPLIGTSANISGSPTCRSGIDVFGTMDGRVDLVLDGGAINGAGATTVDITEPYWRVIREGTISERELAEQLQGS